MPSLVGYSYLMERYNLPALALPVMRVLSESVSNRRVREQGGRSTEEFPRSYEPEHTILGHLRFALRYEGINLQVLGLLFDHIGPDEIQSALRAQPAVALIRRVAYLFEWLTGHSLDLDQGAIGSKQRYVPVLDEALQYGLSPAASLRKEKYKIIDNLPGAREFCPLVRKTGYLARMVGKNLKERTQATLAKYDPKLVMRAARYLYLKETHSSFDIEHVKPTASKAQRFADLLQEAETGVVLSEERFVALQNAVVDPRWMEASYRLEQNWIGTDYGYRRRVDFVPPRPEDVRDLMEGLIGIAERLRARPGALDEVIAASAISFGFVFIHPFKDGNGRVHRFLIHEHLSTTDFTPKGIVLPVSAVILANLDRYKETLEAFSRGVLARTSFDPMAPNVAATGNDAIYFRYPDLTEQASFLYDALDRTVEHDLDEEISFLLGFDRAQTALSSIADWPGHSLDLFIQVVHGNAGKLSINKRRAHFELLTDVEIVRFERIVERAFMFQLDPDEILVLPGD